MGIVNMFFKDLYGFVVWSYIICTKPAFGWKTSPDFLSLFIASSNSVSETSFSSSALSKSNGTSFPCFSSSFLIVSLTRIILLLWLVEVMLEN